MLCRTYSPIICVTTSNNIKFIASGAKDKDVGLWSVPGRELVTFLNGHTDTVFSVKFMFNDEILISGAADYTLRIWSILKRKILKKIDTKSGMIQSLAISNDSKYLPIGDRVNNVSLWNWQAKKK